MRVHFENIFNALRTIKLNGYIFAISILVSLSVLISLGIAYALHLQYVYWAGYACVRIMADNKTMTLRRGIMRCVGTCIGLLLVIVLIYIFRHPWEIIVSICLICVFSMAMAYYFKDYTYFFIMFCVTLGLFFYPYLVISKADAINVVIERTFTTLIGVVVVCVMVLPFLKKSPKQSAISDKDKIKQLKESMGFAIIFAITFLCVFIMAIPFKNVLLFEQALIGVVAVTSAFETFKIRHLSILRFLGCLVGLVLSFILGLLSLGVIWIILVSFLVLFLFSIVQLQGKDISYMGAQASLCFLTIIPQEI
ncbi:FUSC family protein [Cysteiniphilum sp. JM-1]|uniref:FUSC family protein n=1 Tax=Cysteiniphilum sp. JM-1 TaxID=2610891 RepID=UPI0012458ADA|nr:FUSC family protein [Cysteiniphilum sp. JM-1]